MRIIILVSLLVLLNACFVVRAVRKNQYCNKYDVSKIKKSIDSSAIYTYEKTFGNDVYYCFVRFGSNGNKWSCSFVNVKPRIEEVVDSMLYSECYVHLGNTLKWEVYTDGLNGWIQCRAKIIGNGDSLEYFYNGYHGDKTYMIRHGNDILK